MNLRHGLSALGLLVLLGACAAPAPPPPTRISGQIEAATPLNPGPGGGSLPLRVRLYELKNPGTFQSADFFSVWDNPQAKLGADLLGTEDYALQAGARQPFERTLDPQARYVGFVAAYRDLNGAVWRQSLAVPANQTTRLRVQAGTKTLSVGAGQ